VLGRDKLQSRHVAVSGGFVDVSKLERMEEGLSGDEDNWSGEG
jgi:hypothetical protein